MPYLTLLPAPFAPRSPGGPLLGTLIAATLACTPAPPAPVTPVYVDAAADSAPGDTTPGGQTAQDGVNQGETGAEPDAAVPADTPDTAPLADVAGPSAFPVIDPEPPPPCAKAQASADYFQFLDNLCNEKVVPSDSDREFACPVVDLQTQATNAAGDPAVWQPGSAPVVYQNLKLDGLLPAGLQVAVVLIRRVGGVPHYRYLSNGTAEIPVQPWSTSKFLAAANAAVRLRIASNYQVGLTAKVGSLAVGDLVTSLVNYDEKIYTSNALGAWFHNIGGRGKANALVGGDWLKRPASESFGGNYGSPAPASLGYAFVEAGGASVTLQPDTAGSYANNLSMHSLAEALKRLVLHREEASQRLPGIQWADVQTLLYGAAGSATYGPHGGLGADTAIYLQAGHDIQYLDQRAQGHWRVFSKLGLGSKGQFVHVGYACFPVLDAQGQPVVGAGREFVVAAHLAQGGASWAARDRLLAKAYRTIVPRIIDGTL